MPALLSRSNGRRAIALLVAIVAFVFAYETRMLDSTFDAWHTLLVANPPPQPGTRLRFDATAYCKGTTTASGVRVRSGVAAADPQLLPVGSVVNIATGIQKYNGVYTIMDTGPKVQGRILDLYIWSCYEALDFGRRNVEVTVLRLGWDPRASSPSLIDWLFRRREAARKAPTPDSPPPSGISPASEGAGAPVATPPASARPSPSPSPPPPSPSIIP